MLYVFYGSDRQAARDALDAFIAAERPTDAQLTSIEAREYQPGQLADALGATSLFGGTQWCIIDTPSAQTECHEEVLAARKEMAESANTFLVLEGALLAAERKKYATYATTLEEYAAQKPSQFDRFALAQALAARDKRRSWLLLHEARLAGMRDEEIMGMWWWQLKSLRLAAQCSTPAAAGMKPFPFNKAKQALDRFPLTEVETAARTLLDVYHYARAGQHELDLALERWVLRGFC